MHATDNLKSRILARVNLVQLVGKTVELKTRSGLWVGLCPFHEERSPSFTVYPDHYFCFGCQQNGDAITFLRKTSGLSFIEALKFLGSETGIDVSELEVGSNLKKKREDDAELYRIMLAAHDIFTNNLFSPRGRAVLGYLEKRGFKQENIKAYGFGLAFDEPTFVLDALVKQRFSPRQIEACSLASPSAKNGKLFDFFRNRLMVPIHDSSGRLIAFGGRAMDDYPPKYKNSRETRLFDKSATLFGLQHAKQQLRRGLPAIVVEGYMDTLQMWQHGFENTVACMGTALKKSHLQMLAQLCGKVILLFDGDSAGQKASLSAVNVSLEVPDLKMEVVVLPGKDDPDSFLLKNGADAMRNLLSKPEQLLDFALHSKIKSVQGVGIAALAKNELLPWLSKINDSMQRSFLTTKLADLTGISKIDLQAELRESLRDKSLPALRTERQRPTTVSAQARPLSPLEFDLFGHLFFSTNDVRAEILAQVESFLQTELNLDELWLEFGLELIAALRAKVIPHAQPASYWTTANDRQVIELLDKLMQRRNAFEGGQQHDKLQRLLNEKKAQNLRASIVTLKAKLPTASAEQAIEILKSIKNINNNIDNLKTF